MASRHTAVRQRVVKPPVVKGADRVRWVAPRRLKGAVAPGAAEAGGQREVPRGLLAAGVRGEGRLRTSPRQATTLHPLRRLVPQVSYADGPMMMGYQVGQCTYGDGAMSHLGFRR